MNKNLFEYLVLFLCVVALLVGCREDGGIHADGDTDGDGDSDGDTDSDSDGDGDTDGDGDGDGDSDSDGDTDPMMCSRGGGGSGDTCYYSWNCDGTTHELNCDRTANTCSCNGIGEFQVFGDACDLSNEDGTALQGCGWELDLSLASSSCSQGGGGSGDTCYYSWTCDGTTYELHCDRVANLCSCNEVASFSIAGEEACSLSNPKGTANTACGWSLP